MSLACTTVTFNRELSRAKYVANGSLLSSFKLIQQDKLPKLSSHSEFQTASLFFSSSVIQHVHSHHIPFQLCTS